MAKDIYVDTYGRSHIASKVLSSGGQGIVYLTEEPNVLLKLEWNPMTQEIEKDTSNNDKFDDIRILPMLENTNLTLPQTILRDVVGYTMKMLDGMVSFEEAFSGDDYELPDNEWINSTKKANEYLGDRLQKYIATGGMRKRLNAFLNVSCVLSKIHASGLVYCDISEKNMFVSAEPQLSHVWLIDCDNLSFMKESMKKRDGGLHSPGYGAPEIYEGKGKTMYSDAFSFAIALFWELTMSHPFMGFAASEMLDELDMLDAPEEDYTCTGAFAWVCDEEDDSNRSFSGMPIEMFINASLFEKFQKTFSENGRRNRQKRTTMPEWTYVLAKELDHIVRCKCCQMDYYGNEESVCPWCDAENSIIKVSAYKVVGERKKFKWDFIHEISEGVINVPLRVLEGFNSNHLDEKVFRITFIEDGIEIGDLSNQYDFFLNDSTGKQIYGSTKISSTNNIMLSAIDRRNGNDYLLEIEVSNDNK